MANNIGGTDILFLIFRDEVLNDEDKDIERNRVDIHYFCRINCVFFFFLKKTFNCVFLLDKFLFVLVKSI